MTITREEAKVILLAMEPYAKEFALGKEQQSLIKRIEREFPDLVCEDFYIGLENRYV